MPAFHILCLANVSLLLMLLLCVSAVAPRAFAQEDQERTWRDGSVPHVYSVENTGARYRTPNFPSFGKLPIIRPLPDPFHFYEGYRDTSFPSWERRRNEIKAAIEKYEIGPKPDCHDCTITASYVPPAAGSTNGTLTVNVTRKGNTLTLTSGVYIPATGNGPYPALIPMELGGMSFGGTTYTFPPPTPPDYGSLPSSVFSGTPIATVGYVLTQVASYTFSLSAHTSDPFYVLYPELCAGVCTGTSNSGEYAAWSWGVSRLIDGMEIAARQAVNPLPIDMKHLAVTGCSYAGKMALFAGAFDERIALTIAQENGGGGAASWRVSHEIEAQGAVEKVDNTNNEWFAGQMWQFSGDNVYKLPEDHDELMDMVAPRALLQTGNTDYGWLSNRANYVSSRATQRVYNKFGIGDRFGFYIDGGHAHCGTLPAESPDIAAFVNKFLLGQSSVDTDIEVFPTNPPLAFDYTKLDYARWTWWWGRHEDGNHDGLEHFWGFDSDATPRFPNAWNSGGNVVIPLDLNKDHGWNFDWDSLLVTAGQNVEAGYQLKIPGTHPAATATLVDGNVQADIRCFDGTSYTLRIPMPANHAYPIGANQDTWLPGLTTYQGSVTATACSGGSEHGVIVDAYFSALGVSTAAGNLGGASFTTTDTTDPLKVIFGCSANGKNTDYSKPVAINFK
jgi:hypothetical protein